MDFSRDACSVCEKRTKLLLDHDFEQESGDCPSNPTGYWTQNFDGWPLGA
jgi:hypothetical protein